MAKGKKSVWDMNFAKNPEVRERVEDYFSRKVKEVRYQRIQLEQDWMRFFMMWNVTKDGYHSYAGRAQLFIPEVRKNIEAQARQMTESAFPQDDCFDVGPGLSGTKKGAEAWRAMHSWAMSQCNLRLKYFVAMRQNCMLGTAPIYLPWNKKERFQFENYRDAKSKKIQIRKKKVEIFNGPDFIPRDLFKWYSMNPMRWDFQEEGCFEDTVVSRYDLLYKEKNGQVENLKDILDGNSNAYTQEQLQRDVERMESMGLTILAGQGYAGESTMRPPNEDDEDTERDNTYLCTSVFTDFVLPEACEEGEDPEMPIPIQVELYNNEVAGLIRRNPFFHQQAPYVVGKYILPNADEFYGQGIPKATQYMQYELNSKSEQAMDSTTLALNPIAIVDPGLAGSGEEFNIEPGAKWFANPQGVKLAAMPDVSPVGYQAITQIRAQMQDYSDRSPALPPQLLGKSRTATQSQIVENTLSTDNKCFQIQNELTILVPTLEQWEYLIHQNMDDEQIIMILGRRASDFKRTLITKADILGRYAYQWKASSSLQNRLMIGRQMLDAFKTIMMLPPPMMQKLNIQFPEFFKMLWTESWQLPDADRIIGLPETMVTQDAMVENKLAADGLEIEVLPGDDDDGHMKIHDQGIAKAKSEAEKQILMQHNLDHAKQKQAKQQAAQQAQQMMQMQMMMAQQQQQGGQRRSPGSGNRSQHSPNVNPADMASGVRA